MRRLFGARPRLHLTLPEGTSVRLRLETPLSSETAQANQEFRATTSAPLLVDGREAVPAGAAVRGHVSHAAGSGKVSGRGEITLELDQVTAASGEIAIEAQPIQRIARSTAKKDAGKVAAGAGLGALVGGILGGGKGAAIGTAAGAGAGAGVVASTKGDEVVLPAGSTLETRLRSPLTVTVVPKE